MSFCEVEEASSPGGELSCSLRRTDGLKTYLEAETGRKQTDSASNLLLSLPESRLLGLPYELRQRIFEYVFRKEASESFPPQKSRCAARMLGLIVRSVDQPDFLHSRLTREAGREVQSGCCELDELQCPSASPLSSTASRNPFHASAGQPRQMLCYDGLLNFRDQVFSRDIAAIPATRHQEHGAPSPCQCDRSIFLKVDTEADCQCRRFASATRRTGRTDSCYGHERPAILDAAHHHSRFAISRSRFPHWLTTPSGHTFCDAILRLHIIMGHRGACPSETSSKNKYYHRNQCVHRQGVDF